MSKAKFANANNFSLGPIERGIIERIKRLRLSRFGPRGQARFAAALGISSSTYNYYEKCRVPPAHLLVRMAELTGADLAWLLTGRGQLEAGSAAASAGSEAVFQRIARLLEQRPGSKPALLAFLELLENVHAVEEQRKRGGQGSQQSESRPADRPRAMPQRPSARPIPVLGRTAAGVPTFWLRPEDSRALSRQMDAALAMLQSSRQVLGGLGDLAGELPGGAVALVQLTEPVRFAGLTVSEVLDAPEVGRRWPEAFALRIDGESMLPWLKSDDLVLLSPAVAAVDGDVAVVQLTDQVGVTCKVYRRYGSAVRLIPLNPEYPTTVHPADRVTWALRVLARIRTE